MAGPFGDISNSNRDPKDLPVLSKTYTVYHYNYQRGTSEAVEDHIHQIEAVLNFVDGRDRTPPEQWPSLLFWGKFVGSDRTHKIVHPGCGWAHYPPNGEQDYDWANKRFVETDIEDWKPDGSGKKQRINCDRWGGDSLKWFVYWTLLFSAGWKPGAAGIPLSLPRACTLRRIRRRTRLPVCRCIRSWTCQMSSGSWLLCSSSDRFFTSRTGAMSR